MRHIKKLTGLFLVLNTIGAHPVYAEIIASFDRSRAITTSQTTDYINASLTYHSSTTFVSRLGGTIFDSFDLDEADIGESFTVNTSNDTDFQTFANYLVDGLNYYIADEIFANGLGISIPTEESTLVGNSAFSSNNIDLQGYQINSISFTINSLTLNELQNTGSPASPVYSYNHSVAGTFTIDGIAIPEPNSVALLLVGTGVLYLRRKRFSNQRVDPTRYNAR